MFCFNWSSKVRGDVTGISVLILSSQYHFDSAISSAIYIQIQPSLAFYWGHVEKTYAPLASKIIWAETENILLTPTVKLPIDCELIQIVTYNQLALILLLDKVFSSLRCTSLISLLKCSGASLHADQVFGEVLSSSSLNIRDFQWQMSDD